MLLKAGADPNLKVFSEEFDRNSQLRPVLVEYLASNEHPSFEVVQLLLQYGAKVTYNLYYYNKEEKFFCLFITTKPYFKNYLLISILNCTR